MASDRSQKAQAKSENEILVSWMIELKDAQSFYIDLSFSEPTFVSQYEEQLDSIVVRVKRADAFVDQDGKATFAPDDKKASKVPNLVKYQTIQVEEIKSIGNSFADTVKDIMACNLIISLVFAGALQYLWGMVNIINLAILYGIFLPENLHII